MSPAAAFADPATGTRARAAITRTTAHRRRRTREAERAVNFITRPSYRHEPHSVRNWWRWRESNPRPTVQIGAFSGCSRIGAISAKVLCSTQHSTRPKSLFVLPHTPVTDAYGKSPDVAQMVRRHFPPDALPSRYLRSEGKGCAIFFGTYWLSTDGLRDHRESSTRFSRLNSRCRNLSPLFSYVPRVAAAPDMTQ